MATVRYDYYLLLIPIQKHMCMLFVFVLLVRAHRHSSSLPLSSSYLAWFAVRFLFYLYIQGTFWWLKVISSIDRCAGGLVVRWVYDLRRHLCHRK